MPRSAVGEISRQNVGYQKAPPKELKKGVFSFQGYPVRVLVKMGAFRPPLTPELARNFAKPKEGRPQQIFTMNNVQN